MAWSQTWTFVDGDWREGNTPLLGARSHGMWQASVVFDGARVFEGVAPDLDRHLARIGASARALGLAPTHDAATIAGLVADGRAKFATDTALYVRPMYWAEEGGFYGVAPDPATTRFALSLYEAPMPPPTGFSVGLSPFRRPAQDMAPTDAKAACLYPNSGRAIAEAQARGFDSAVLLDAVGNVAETATSNLFLVKDGVVATPVANGSFLAGVTRRRVIDLLRGDGVTVEERTVRWAEALAADEAFSTGNYAKVTPITGLEARRLQPGPVFARVRALYWAFAHGQNGA